MTHPRLAFDPLARRALRHGFNHLADLMAVTLGPRGRLVAVARDNPRRAPELLNHGATVARRFLGLPNRFETMGAFLARHIAWRMAESVGDGATTAVVIARQVLNQMDRLAAAGHNVMQVRRGMEKATQAVLTELKTQARPLTTPASIRALAAALTGDGTLGNHLEEIFDTVGPYGAVDVRTNYARTHDRQYIHGAFWNQGWVSSYFTTEAGTAVLKDPYLLLTNRHLRTADELLPILEQVRQATGQGSPRGLVVIAPGVEKDALNLLVTNKTRGALPTLAIKAPGLGAEKSEILQDLAVLSGGRLFLAEEGRRLETATLTDLGGASEVQAIRSGFTLIGGKGRPAAIRQRHQELRQKATRTPPGRERDRLGERAGKLLGGVALLKVGAATETELEVTKERAKAAVQTLRLALQEGIAPGAGVAYLRCLPALERLTLPADEAAAIPVLRAALLAPLRAILHNSGYEPGPIIARVQAGGANCGFDVMQGKLVDVVAAHLVDPVRVLHSALQTGVSGALMGMTTDVLIHKPRHNRDEDVDFRP